MTHNPKHTAAAQKFRVETHELRLQNHLQSASTSLVSKTILVLTGTPEPGSIANRAFVEFVPEGKVRPAEFTAEGTGGTIRFSARLSSLPALPGLLAQATLYVTYSQNSEGLRDAVLSRSKYT